MQAFWILVATLLTTLTYVFMKMTPPGYAFYEIFFVRAVFMLLVVLGFLWVRRVPLKTAHSGLHLLRVLCGVLALNCNIVVTQHLALGTAQTLAYTTPLFVGLFWTLTAIWSRRPVSWAMIGTILVGFSGVYLMMRPSFSEAQLLYTVLGLTSGLSAAFASLMLNALGQRGEPVLRTVFYFALGSVVLSGGVVALSTHQAFSTLFWEPTLLMMGLCTAGAQLAQTQAWGHGHTLLCANLQFSAILFGTFFGWWLFAERLDALTYAGIGIILVAEVLATVIKMRAPRQVQRVHARGTGKR